MSAALLFTTHTAECTDIPAFLDPRHPFLELREEGAVGPPSKLTYTVLYLPPVGCPKAKGGFAAFLFTYSLHAYRIAPRKILKGNVVDAIACQAIVDWVG